MSFRNRLLLGNALIIAVFVAAVVVANNGLRSTAERFGSFLDGIGSLQQNYQEMYSQGLQMGQALRNIVLDPANPKAYENLDKARKDFSGARDQAVQAARRVDGFAEPLNRLAPLADAQAKAQADVLAALKAGRQEDARSLINSQETPAWRALKKALLDDLEAIRKATDSQRASVHDNAARMQQIILVLSGLAVLAAIASVVTMLAYVRRELGGEPSYARHVARAVATGDLTQPIAIGSDDQHSLLAALAAMQAQLRELVGTLVEHARQVEQTAGEMADSTGRVAAGGQQQLAVADAMVNNARAVAESLREVMSAVDQADRIVRESNAVSTSGVALAGKAATETQTMAAAVQATASDIRDLGMQSTQISSILAVISDIAGQTNLLALNAAIEAARAGEQGRGFAVVADEVRKLAERTAQSTAEISAMVQGIQVGTTRAVDGMENGLQQVEHSVALSNQARDAFAQMNISSGEVQVVVGQIVAAIGVESQNEKHMQAHITEARSLIEGSTRAMQTVVESAGHLKAMSAKLTQQATRFRL